MTWSYTTSMLFSDRIASTAEAGATASDCATAVTCSPFLASPRAGRGDMPARLLRLRRLVAGLGALRPRLVLGHIVLGGGIEQRLHLVLHGRDPIGDLDPLGAVPLLHVRPRGGRCGPCSSRRSGRRSLRARVPSSAPPMIFRLSKPRRTSSALTTFLPVSCWALRIASATIAEFMSAAVVEVLADLVLQGLALALLDDVFHDVLDSRIVGTRRC